MKPFNLEAALRGEKVVMQDGREVTQLTQFKCASDYPLYGVIENSLVLGTWTISGKWFNDSQNELPSDLFMATKMRKVSYRFYKSHFSQPGVFVGSVDFLDHLQNKSWLSDILEVEIEDDD